MTEDDGQAEDVAGLFRRFGGDATGYKEFAPAADAERPAGAWPLVPGLPPTAAAVRGAAEEPAVPPAVPAAAAFASSHVDRPAPITAPVMAPTAAPATMARELDLLFARLAGQPPGQAALGSGPLSQWRRSS